MTYKLKSFESWEIGKHPLDCSLSLSVRWLQIRLAPQIECFTETCLDVLRICFSSAKPSAPQVHQKFKTINLGLTKP